MAIAEKHGNAFCLQVTADSVSISGERKEETLSEEKGVTRSEFRYGKFALSYSSTSENSKHQCHC